MSDNYTDFDISFDQNANGDIKQLSDEGCIRQVIKNSVNMNSYDIPFNAWYAANIKHYLFENPNKITESEMKKSITDVLLLDSRLSDPTVEISYSNDQLFCIIDITVYVSILGSYVTEQITVDRVK